MIYRLSESRIPRYLNVFTLVSGKLCSSRGTLGIVGVLFLNISMYLHFDRFKVRKFSADHSCNVILHILIVC